MTSTSLVAVYASLLLLGVYCDVASRVIEGNVPAAESTSTPDGAVIASVGNSGLMSASPNESSENANHAACGGNVSEWTLYKPPVNERQPEFYAHEAHCHWLIENPKPSSNTIVVQFFDFHLEEGAACRYDYASIYAEDAAGVIQEPRRYCGNLGNFSLLFHHRRVHVVFRSDGSVAMSRGFSVSAVFPVDATAENLTVGGILNLSNPQPLEALKDSRNFTGERDWDQYLLATPLAVAYAGNVIAVSSLQDVPFDSKELARLNNRSSRDGAQTISRSLRLEAARIGDEIARAFANANQMMLLVYSRSVEVQNQVNYIQIINFHERMAEHVVRHVGFHVRYIQQYSNEITRLVNDSLPAFQRIHNLISDATLLTLRAQSDAQLRVKETRAEMTAKQMVTQMLRSKQASLQQLLEDLTGEDTGEIVRDTTTNILSLQRHERYLQQRLRILEAIDLDELDRIAAAAGIATAHLRNLATAWNLSSRFIDQMLDHAMQLSASLEQVNEHIVCARVYENSQTPDGVDEQECQARIIAKSSDVNSVYIHHSCPKARLLERASFLFLRVSLKGFALPVFQSNATLELRRKDDARALISRIWDTYRNVTATVKAILAEQDSVSPHAVCRSIRTIPTTTASPTYPSTACPTLPASDKGQSKQTVDVDVAEGSADIIQSNEV